MTIVTVRRRQWVTRRRSQGGAYGRDLRYPPKVNNVASPYEDDVDELYDELDPQDPNGSMITYQFLFWNVIGSDRGNYTDRRRRISVGLLDTPVTLTAWYRPLGKDGLQADEVAVDGFSSDADEFFPPIDSPMFPPIERVDPAGQRGIGRDDDLVRTDKDVSIYARPQLDGALDRLGGAPLSFQHWIASACEAPTGDPITFAKPAPPRKPATGAVIACYRRPEPLRRPGGGGVPEEGGRVLGGVSRDGGGWVVPWGGGPPIPVDPWDPLVRTVTAALAVHKVATSLPAGEARTTLEQQALQIIADATKKKRT